jgi:histidinol-phosphatase (PHP family)
MDIHLHSRFSLDSDMDMASAIRKSISSGYSRIAFTDHVDLDYPGYGNGFNVDFADYFNRIDDLQKIYTGIEILKGVEAGVTAGTLDNVRDYLSGYGFDYVILSEHIVLGEDPYTRPDLYYDHDKNELYRQYLNDLYNNMLKYEDFDTLGHYDYITRYSVYDDPNITYELYKEEFDRIFAFIVSNNKAFEVNTRTYDGSRYGPRKFDQKILKAYKDHGGKYVCLGSDAHNESSIGYKFDQFKQIIMDAGFSGLTYFRKRKAVIEKF